jgi:hypothetical protein
MEWLYSHHPIATARISRYGEQRHYADWATHSQLYSVRQKYGLTMFPLTNQLKQIPDEVG